MVAGARPSAIYFQKCTLCNIEYIGEKEAKHLKDTHKHIFIFFSCHLVLVIENHPENQRVDMFTLNSEYWAEINCNSLLHWRYGIHVEDLIRYSNATYETNIHPQANDSGRWSIGKVS